MLVGEEGGVEMGYFQLGAADLAHTRSVLQQYTTYSERAWRKYMEQQATQQLLG